MKYKFIPEDKRNDLEKLLADWELKEDDENSIKEIFRKMYFYYIASEYKFDEYYEELFKLRHHLLMSNALEGNKRISLKAEPLSKKNSVIKKLKSNLAITNPILVDEINILLLKEVERKFALFWEEKKKIEVLKEEEKDISGSSQTNRKNDAFISNPKHQVIAISYEIRGILYKYKHFDDYRNKIYPKIVEILQIIESDFFKGANYPSIYLEKMFQNPIISESRK